jgi:hypothetical protein
MDERKELVLFVYLTIHVKWVPCHHGTKYYTGLRTHMASLDERPKLRKMGMTFGTWRMGRYGLNLSASG